MKALALVACLLWGAVLGVAGWEEAAPAFAPSNARERFAVDLLARLGNTAPTAETVAFVVEWTMAEDGGDGALARFNPLNTTQASDADTMVINSDGVRGYATYEDGLDATVRTITNGMYDPLVAALLANDPDAALRALVASPWASSHYNGGAGWPQASAPSGVASSPIAYQGDDCAWNVAVALEAIGSEVVIPAGGWWSFNQAMGDPGRLDYRTCAGVPGGNWCNLAARYAQVGRALGARLTFQDHGVDLGAGRENSVTIWNEGGQPGGQDLIIENVGGSPLRFSVQDIGGGQIEIVGES